MLAKLIILELSNNKESNNFGTTDSDADNKIEIAVSTLRAHTNPSNLRNKSNLIYKVWNKTTFESLSTFWNECDRRYFSFMNLCEGME